MHITQNVSDRFRNNTNILTCKKQVIELSLQVAINTMQ